jgi:ssDNA-binding Zn-finger/Zn-ribbon topoisomerase 1
MPYALCSNSECDHSIELHDSGRDMDTPIECPRCKSSMISLCPECGFLLMGTPGATVCAVCRADIRRVFVKWRARAQST